MFAQKQCFVESNPGDKKSRVAGIYEISATRLSARDPWAFRPILANGLVVSLSLNATMFHYSYHKLFPAVNNFVISLITRFCSS